MQIPKTPAAMRSLGAGALAVGGVGAAGVAGFAGAHAATNRGDYENSGKWMAAAAVTAGATALVGGAMAFTGRSLVKGTLNNVPALATEMEAAALATASATAAKKGPAAARLEEARAALTSHVDGNQRRLKAGNTLSNGGLALGVGAAGAMMLTNARLNPGILKVEISGGVLLDEPTTADRVQEEIADAGEVAQDAASGFSGWVSGLLPGD